MIPSNWRSGIKVEIRAISVMQYMPQLRELSRQHWEETESSISSGPDIVEASYQALEDAGATVAFAAFDGDEIVGYSCAFIAPHIHYGFLYAHHDVLFVRKELRGGPIGVRLIRKTEQAAAERQAKWIFWHAKPNSTFDTLLPRMGYSLEEYVYKKELTCPQPSQ